MTTDHLAAEGRAAAKAILRRFAAGRSYAARDFENGIWNATIEVPVAIDAMIEVLGRLDRMTEALEKARDRFLEYEHSHNFTAASLEAQGRREDAGERRSKAVRNRKMADLCARALGGQVGEG